MPIDKKASSKASPSYGIYAPSIPTAVIEMLTDQAQRMVEESGSPDGFDVQTWLFDWLHSPVPALGKLCPIDFLHTPEGVDLISRLLASAQTGAYW